MTCEQFFSVVIPCNAVRLVLDSLTLTCLVQWCRLALRLRHSVHPISSLLCSAMRSLTRPKPYNCLTSRMSFSPLTYAYANEAVEFHSRRRNRGRRPRYPREPPMTSFQPSPALNG